MSKTKLHIFPYWNMKHLGRHKIAKKSGISKGTIYTWIKAFKEDCFSANEAVHLPEVTLSINDERYI